MDQRHSPPLVCDCDIFVQKIWLCDDDCDCDNYDND